MSRIEIKAGKPARITVDFTPELGDDEKVTQASWTLKLGGRDCGHLLKPLALRKLNAYAVTISGGQAGCEYELVCRAKTDAKAKLERSIWVMIKAPERQAEPKSPATVSVSQP